MVAQRRKELVQQIAVGRVDLDHLEPGRERPPRGRLERGDHPRDPGLVKRPWGSAHPRGTGSGWGRRPSRPPLPAVVSRAPPFQGGSQLALRPAWRELDAGDRPLRLDEPDDPGQRFDVRVGPRSPCRRARSGRRGSRPSPRRTPAPTPPAARLPRWTRCQSFAIPSSAQYWHIGDITIRLRKLDAPNRQWAQQVDLGDFRGRGRSRTRIRTGHARPGRSSRTWASPGRFDVAAGRRPCFHLTPGFPSQDGGSMRTASLILIPRPAARGPVPAGAGLP